MAATTNAWVHRLSPAGIDRLSEIALPQNLILNGWSGARGLEKIAEWYQFREVIKQGCYPSDKNYRRAGLGGASIWSFLHDMKPGDLVVVPHWGGVFYVARITGPAYVEDTAEARAIDAIYRRPVEWLNEKKSLPRILAKSGLRSRMKTRQTTAKATEFVADIEHALALAGGQASSPSAALFSEGLRQKLIQAALTEIETGHMGEREFERLVALVLTGMGAKDCKIIGRRADKGVDIRAVFSVGPTEVIIGVQVKYHKGRTEAHWLPTFLKGLESEGIDIGWFITSAEFSDDFEDRAKELSEEHGKEIQVISGSEFAAMVIDYGLRERRES